MEIILLLRKLVSIAGDLFWIVAAAQSLGILPFPLWEVNVELSNFIALVSLTGAVVFSIWVGYELKTWWAESRKVKIGSKHFDSSFYLIGELGHLDPLLTIPRERLWVMGVSLHEFSRKYCSDISKLLERGVSVRFLLLKPSLAQKFVDATGAKDTKSYITTSRDELIELRSRHAKLEAKWHGFLPFHSMIVVDDSFIQVGFYLYKKRPPERPQAIVSKLLHKDIFDLLESSYDELWKTAEPI